MSFFFLPICSLKNYLLKQTNKKYVVCVCTMTISSLQGSQPTVGLGQFCPHGLQLSPEVKALLLQLTALLGKYLYKSFLPLCKKLHHTEVNIS